MFLITNVKAGFVKEMLGRGGVRKKRRRRWKRKKKVKKVKKMNRSMKEEDEGR